MRANLGDIYNQTITVVNKLDARDSATRQDTYYATVIEHCMWADKVTRSVQSDGTVKVGVTHQVQIPESENYKPYRAWRLTEERKGSFTLTEGDYIFKGELEEEVTASNLRSLVSLYEPNVFQIQSFRDATKGEGFTHSTDGIMRFTEMYYVEG